LAPVTFVTLARFAPVAARLEGVFEVLSLAPGERLADLARRLPSGVPRVDLHASLRSRILWFLSGGSWRRVRRYDLRRRLRVALKVAPPPPVVDRYARAAGVEAASWPWIQICGPRDALLLVPGAAWATKRWPAERFAAVGRSWDGPVVVLGGPEEGRVCREVADGVGSRAEVVCENGFQRTFDALGRGQVVVGNDTGLTHLAAAAGLRAVVVFGGTSSRDGYWKGDLRAMEADLPCRPCARFGAAVCPIGDHLCMDRVHAADVIEALPR